MSEINNLYRTYDDFSLGAIRSISGTPNVDYGWENEYANAPTPITADNLDAMLKMLIYIRNVIGKTTDFTTAINGHGVPAPQPTENVQTTLAYYLKDAFDAIIGTGDDTNNTTITRTLAGLKAYLESLDVSDQGASTSKWINKVTQTDGKVAVEYSQPDASDITYIDENKGTNLADTESVNSALNTLDIIIGDLTTLDFENIAEISIDDLDSIIKIIQKVINDRISATAALDARISTVEAKFGEGEGTVESQISEAISNVQSQIDDLDNTYATDEALAALRKEILEEIEFIDAGGLEDWMKMEINQ